MKVKQKKGSLMREIGELRETRRCYENLLRWHIEHAKEVMEIENRGLRR